MKKIILFLLLPALLLCACTGETASPETGHRVFGEFVTTDMAGNPVTEQVFSGHKLTMVNIWGTFCQPCIKEMPALAQLQAAYGEDLQVIGICYDIMDKNGNILQEKRAKAEEIIQSAGADYLQLLPSATLNKAFLNQVTAVPVTIFLDENGNQIGAQYPGAKTESQWQKIIDSLLA